MTQVGCNSVVTPTSQDSENIEQKGDIINETFESEATPTKMKMNKNKRKRRQRRGNKSRRAPYSAKHFLGRPKINAPANTTQFIFEDKQLSTGELFCVEKQHRAQDLSSNSESECSVNTSSSTLQASLTSEAERDVINYQSDRYAEDNDRFMTEEFDRMYDDVRAELLRSLSSEELTCRCIELESAIHNLRYLLQREAEKRQKVEEILYLTEINKKLCYENIELKSHNKNEPHSDCSIDACNDADVIVSSITVDS